MANIIITGCSTGIGFATAVLLAKNKHVVFATMRHPEQHSELQDIADNKNLPIVILPLDVTSSNSVKNAMSQVLFYTDKIDVLINNAGTGSLGAVEELPIENFINEMDTNFIGTVRCTKAVLPHMRQKKSGCIINISSVGGKLFNYFNASYSATKLLWKHSANACDGNAAFWNSRGCRRTRCYRYTATGQMQTQD